MSFIPLFDDLSTNRNLQLNGQSEAAKSELKCSSCGSNARDLNALEIHITVDHLDWVPFQCFYCQFVRLPTEFALRTHLKALHPNRDPMVIYKINDTKREQLSTLISQSLDLQSQANGSGKESDSGRPTIGLEATAAVDDRDRFSAIRVISADSSPSTSSLPFSPSLFDKLDADGLSAIQSSQKSTALIKSSHRAQSLASMSANSLVLSPMEVKTEPIDAIDQSSTAVVPQSSQCIIAENECSQSPTIDDDVMPPLSVQTRNPLTLTNNSSNGTSCRKCGDEVYTANEQREHVLRKHLEKRQLCCKSCAYKTNIYNNAYMHVSSTHKLRNNRMGIIDDLRQQYIEETKSMIKACFPNGAGPLRPNFRHSFDSAVDLKKRSRLSLSTPPVLTESTYNRRASIATAGRLKTTFPTTTLVCEDCSSRIRGSGYGNFEQHAMLHFHLKRYQCEGCSFATNRRRQADAHTAAMAHQLKSKQRELHEDLQKVVFQCFPKLPNKIGMKQK